MRVYIAGPMTGRPLYNFSGFDNAKAEWEARGHRVTTPADITRRMWAERFCRTFDPQTDRCEYGDALMCDLFAADIEAVTKADAIAVLAGWPVSKGAKIEIAVARALGKPVYDAETFALLEVEIQTTPVGPDVPREVTSVAA